ncbi:DUF4142 domain-containing protein [Nonomuraea sp. NPDC004186]|uniref:DUF4142 domain-containing protein n=1 Tax=Nonomuraea sp. NPDC049625 TaxID=3155775 RepID=UPI0034227E4B
MRLLDSRRALISCGIAALCTLTACAGYTPTPVSDTAGLSTEPTAGLSTEPTAVETGPTDAPTVQPVEDEPEARTRQTKWGPLSEADQELIKKVRLASLWEMPMAQDAIQRANSARVRQVSKEIAAQHDMLDGQVRDVAAKLKVKLPVKPTPQQQDWMTDISGRSGSAYDKTYVKWLRLAHGQIFTLIGTVRGTTQNTLVRRFSEQANAAVLNHQRLLESTGLTTPESFPTPSI